MHDVVVGSYSDGGGGGAVSYELVLLWLMWRLIWSCVCPTYIVTYVSTTIVTNDTTDGSLDTHTHYLHGSVTCARACIFIRLAPFALGEVEIRTLADGLAPPGILALLSFIPGMGYLAKRRSASSLMVLLTLHNPS